mgnify:CR=1 FL=1
MIRSLSETCQLSRMRVHLRGCGPHVDLTFETEEPTIARVTNSTDVAARSA